MTSGNQLDLFPRVVHCRPSDHPGWVNTAYGMCTRGGSIHLAWMEMERLGIQQPTQAQWLAALAVADQQRGRPCSRR